MIYGRLKRYIKEILCKKEKNTINIIIYIILVIILIQFSYIRFSIYIKKDIGNTDMLIANDIANKINIDEKEINRLISLNFNELINDKINRKFENKTRYVMKYLNIKRIYFILELPKFKIKYNIKKEDAKIYNETLGAPLNGIYLLDSIISDSERKKQMKNGVYRDRDRYTILDKQYKKVSKTKEPDYFFKEYKNDRCLTAYAPIVDAYGKVIGVIGVDTYFDEFANKVKNNVYGIISISIINTIIFLIIIKTLDKLKKKNDVIVEKVRYLSLCSLTGTLNRACFMEIFKQQINISKLNKLPISIIFVDMDYFKEYNDNYGHIAGDENLKKIALVLKEIGKNYSGIVVRYGGDEFIMLLTGINEKETKRIANEILNNVNSLKIEHKYSKIKNYQTVSIGITSTIPNELTNVEEIIHHADIALYESKKKGKNRISIWKKPC